MSDIPSANRMLIELSLASHNIGGLANLLCDVQFRLNQLLELPDNLGGPENDLLILQKERVWTIETRTDVLHEHFTNFRKVLTEVSKDMKILADSIDHQHNIDF